MAETPSQVERAVLPVLLVDDSPTNLRVTGAALSRLGCDVTTVESGEKALAAVEATRFALILLDYQMPGMDGPETARRVIDRLGPEAPPILALTGDVDLEVFRACRQAGMRLVLKKPVKRDHLEAILDRLRTLRASAAS